MNKRVNIAGLEVDMLTKPELLKLLESKVSTNQKTWVTTVYSEFLHAALEDPSVKNLLNKSDLSLADGIGIFWAEKFLSKPLTLKSYYGKIFQSFCQAVTTLIEILFSKKGVNTLPGSELIWDICSLSEKNNWSVFLLGGFGDTPKIASEKISIKFPNLKINFSNKNPNETSVTQDINSFKPDILFVAFGPLKQEEWIFENLKNLNTVKLAMGIGGTFDYIAGKKISPPKFIRTVGLEWLWRLLTQPSRYKRIYKAFFGLINLTILYKIYSAMPYRKNVVSVILNKKNQILICQRNPNPPATHAIGENLKNKYQNYWQLPQGGIDNNEELLGAAQREALEETGLKGLKLIEISKQEHSYWFNLSWKRIFDKYYRWKGQTQNIVYLRHTGANEEVKVDNYEFVNFAWVEAEKLHSILHTERKELGNKIIADLKEMLEKGKLT